MGRQRSEVMIVGSGRSGTTWLARIFDSHPTTLYRHEPESLLADRIIPFAPLPEQFEDMEADARRLYEAMKSARGLRAVGKRPMFRKSYRGGVARVSRRSLIFLGQLVGRVVRTDGMPIPDMVGGDGSAQPVSVIKSVVSNMRLPVLARALPAVKFILILRHPCGVVASLDRGVREGKMPAPRIYDEQLQLPTAVRRGLTREVADQLEPHETAAAVWAVTNEYAIEHTRDLSNVRVLKYENLCAEPLDVARDLLEWAGLSWADETEAFVGLSVVATGDAAAYHAVVRDPLQAANRWKTTLPESLQQDVREVVAGSAPAQLYPDLA